MIYLDNAATTPVSPGVLEAMLPYLKDDFGNPGGRYCLGRRAYAAVERARSQVAELFHCSPHQVIFTSGGSEANNLAIRGACNDDRQRETILISAGEHDSVRKSAQKLAEYGYDLRELPLEPDGTILPDLAGETLRSNAAAMLCVMAVNNETGAVNPIEEIGRHAEKYGTVFHVDCVQAAGTFVIDVNRMRCDSASISGHKIHGPKGVGALFVRNPNRLTPLVYGGAEQEFGLRGGTENVPGIVGLGAACAAAGERLRLEYLHVSEMKQVFYTALQSALHTLGLDHIVHVNGPSVVTPGKVLNLRIDGVDAETLLILMDSYGVCISAGSACRSHEAHPSHVLKAMGLTDEEARSSIRVSFSDLNTHEEVAEAAGTLAHAVSQLLAVGKGYA